MNIEAIKLCRECGQPVAADAILGVCPQCMMKAGLAASSKASIVVAPDAFVEGPETETKEFVPGTRLGYIGDYELLEQIARGGMGVVYKARQSSLKRIVAVKMIRSGELADEAEVQRFRTEAQAAAQLQHPNIVAIHEIGEHQRQHYFSMDFVEGKNLAQVADGRPVAARSAAEWLKAIAGAVQFAHLRGVLHRDLKPQNIMLDAAGRPRVMDFGLAKNLGGDSALTKTGAVMGSPSYMSPEQARGRNDLVGPASDVYSLGAVLYELLTGRPPFRGESPMGTLSQVVNDDPPPPRSFNPSVPADMETICLKCLEKEPVRRYPTARELEADLGRFLDGEPVQARPASAMRRTMSWFRRHRWVFSVAVSVLVLTLMGLAYGLWEQTQFLTWLNTHPDYVKAPGPREAALSSLLVGRVSPLIMMSIPIVAVLFLLLQKFTTGASWKRILSSPVQPPPLDLTIAFVAISASAGLVGSLFLAAKTLQVFVWEGVFSYHFLVAFPLVFIFSVGALMEVVRLQTRISIEPFPLSPEQLAPVHEAVFAGRTYDAIKHYRAATGANGARALEDIGNMETALRQAHPEKFSTRVLNRPYMGAVVCAWLVWASMFLGGLWEFFTPQTDSHSNLSSLGNGLLLGVMCRALSYGGMARWKRTRPWIRFLACCAFAIAGVLLTLMIVSPYPTERDPKFVLSLCSSVAGWLLVHLVLKKWKAS